MEKITLTVNGRDYRLEVDPKWSLLRVLRECLHLTGAKEGCGNGQCGACKVIIDGKAVNSCTLPVGKAAGKSVTTIEGLAKGDGLDPVQQAFIDAGAIQCGFCTPGMIMAVKALFNRKPGPSEEEVHQALKGNLCRCTGYVHIIEAVRLLNEARGGQKTAGASWIGRSLPQRDAVLKATGRLKYTQDITLPHMLTGRLFLSPVAHARIKRIDCAKALALPGVWAVLTHENTPGVPFNSGIWYTGQDAVENEVVFPPVVRHVGDRVAAVAAESPEIAREALSLIEVEYELLETLFAPEEALQPETIKIHPEGNQVGAVNVSTGDADKALAKSPMVKTDSIKLPMVHSSALEPHVCLANPEGDKLTIYTPNQNVFAVRMLLAQILGMSMNRIRVIKPPIGGSFGSKLEMTIEPVAALLALAAQRPVQLLLSREETFIATRVRHRLDFQLTSGASPEGTLLVQRFDATANTGAYCGTALNMAPGMASKVFKLYKTPVIEFQGRCVYTNSIPAGSVRGFGSPQLCTASQIHLSNLARTLGIDPVEFQLKNLLEADGRDRQNGMSLGHVGIKECVEQGAELFKWREKRQAAIRGDIATGVGMACCVHSNGIYQVHVDHTSNTLKINDDGSAILITGAQDVGCGTSTILSQILAEELGLDLSQITIYEADTECSGHDIGTIASRTTWKSAAGVYQLAQSIKQKLLTLTAGLFEVGQEKLSWREGKIQVEGKGVFSLAQLIPQFRMNYQTDSILTQTYKAPCSAWSYAAHFAQVEVNKLTGHVKVIDYLAAHDVGTPINPLLTKGQIHGGVSMGLGYALSEEMIADSTAKITNANFGRYKLIRSAGMPPIQVLLVKGREQAGAYGAKGVGEIATVPVAAAVVNAVVDALGVEIRELPLTPQRVLALINN